jgi:hypothetical protein
MHGSAGALFISQMAVYEQREHSDETPGSLAHKLYQSPRMFQSAKPFSVSGYRPGTRWHPQFPVVIDLYEKVVRHHQIRVEVITAYGSRGSCLLALQNYFQPQLKTRNFCS